MPKIFDDSRVEVMELLLAPTLTPQQRERGFVSMKSRGLVDSKAMMLLLNRCVPRKEWKMALSFVAMYVDPAKHSSGPKPSRAVQLQTPRLQPGHVEHGQLTAIVLNACACEESRDRVRQSLRTIFFASKPK